MQNKVSHLEHSLQSVTAESRSVIQNFNASYSESRSRVSVSHARDEVPHRQRLGGGAERNHTLTRSDSEEESSSLETASRSRIRVNRVSRSNPKLPHFTGKETWKVWFKQTKLEF